MKKFLKFSLSLSLLIGGGIGNIPINSIAEETQVEVVETVESEESRELILDSEGIKVELVQTHREETNTVLTTVFIETEKSIELQDENGNSQEDKKTEDGSYVFEYPQNGEYHYQVVDINDTESTPVSFSIQVDKIVVQESQVPTEKELRRASALSVSIPGLYEPEVNEWELQSSTSFNYSAMIAATFSDSAIDKRLRITLPEGIRFMKYGVLENPDASKNQVLLDGTPADFLKAMISTPERQEFYDSYNVGSLEYQFSSGTESIPLSIGFEVDTMVYYGPKKFPEGFKVEVIEDGEVVQEITKSINATTVWQMSWTTLPRVTAIAKSGEYLAYGFPVPYVSNGPTGGNGSYQKYAKEYTIKHYYPDGFTLKDGYAGKPAENVVEINREENSITQSFSNIVQGGNVYTSYLMVELNTLNVAEPGMYKGKNQELQITTYDGTIITQSDKPLGATDSGVNRVTPLSVNVVDENDPAAKNMLSYSGEQVISYAPVSDEYEVAIPNRGKFIANGGNKTNQTFEYKIPNDFEATSIGFLKGDGNGVITMYYRTNKNETLQSITSDDPRIVHSATKKTMSITKEKLGLAEDEYFTYGRAYIGTFNPGDLTHIAMGKNDPLVVGKLGSRASSANIQISSYASMDGGITRDEKTLAELNFEVLRIDLKDAQYSGAATSSEGVVPAGESIKLRYGLSVAYPYTNTQSISNPQFCFVAPKNTMVDADAAVAWEFGRTYLGGSMTGEPAESIKKVVEVSLLSQRMVEGRQISCFTVNGNAGYQFNHYNKELLLEIKLDTTIQAGGSYSQSVLGFWSASENQGEITNSTSGYSSVIVDADDFDNDGNTTERMLPVLSRNLSITPKTGIIVDTSIRVQGEEKEPAFDVNNPQTAVKFTPRTITEYEVDIINNGTSSTERLEVYIPIPKTGKDFGSNFQSQPFKWDLSLERDPVVNIYNGDGTLNTAAVSNYVIEYASDPTITGNTVTATWKSTWDSSTTMIRITNTVGMLKSEKMNITFNYQVAEDETSVIANPEKLNAVQDFRPHYYYNIPGEAAGYLQGTRVGVELVIGKIEGRVFEDADLNGLFNTGDKVLEGKEVTLYRLVSRSYTSVATVTTGADGIYKFENLGDGTYKVDFSDVPTEDQQFTKMNIGNDETIDSDVVISGDDAGYAINVNPADTSSNNVDAGVVNYNPTNLSVNINEGDRTLLQWNSILQTGTREVLTTTINPENFDSIKAKADSIVWESSDSSIVGVSNGGIQGNAVGEATITVTVKDMYGNTSKSSVKVTVTPNTPPTIETSGTAELTHELGVDYTKDLKSLVTVSDEQDSPINLDRLVVTGSVDTTVVGENKISYEYTDKDGNIATHSLVITVQDTTAPTVTIENNPVLFEVSETINVDTIYAAAGVTISDASTTTWVINGMDDLDLTAIGTDQTVELVVTDEQGNSTTKTITIQLESTLEVKATNSTVTFEMGESITEEEIISRAQLVVTDGRSITPSISEEMMNSIDDSAIGKWTVDITVKDNFGSERVVTVTVDLKDTVKPTVDIEKTSIRLRYNTVAEKVILAAMGTIKITDFTATTATLSDVSAIDKSKIESEQVLTYSVTDEAGNTTETQIKITLFDDVKPGVDVENTEIQFELGEEVTTEAILEKVGTVTINDVSTTTTTVVGDVDDTTVGSQTVALVVEDAYGNVKNTPVVVTVQDTTAPTIELSSEQINYEDDVIISEEDFLADVVSAVSDNSEVTITSNYSTEVDFDALDGWFSELEIEVEITATDEQGNSTTETVTVILVSKNEYYVEISDVSMEVSEYLAALENGTLEEKVLEISEAAAGAEHPRRGSYTFDVEVDSLTQLPTTVQPGDEIEVTINAGVSDSSAGNWISRITQRGIETPLLSDSFKILINPDAKEDVDIYTLNFYDCNKNVVSQDWVLQGNDGTPNKTYTYPTPSYKNVQGNLDIYPTNCSGGFVIPNTGK